MSYGILNVGRDTKRQAMAGLRQAASEENSRNMANRNIEHMERQGKKQMAGTGAAMGLQYGLTNGIPSLGGASTVANAISAGKVGSAAAAGTAGAVSGASGGVIAAGAAAKTATAAGSAAAAGGSLAAGLATGGIGLLAGLALTELF